MKLVVESCGLVNYRRAYERQLQLVEALRQDRSRPDTCLVLEHEPVFTLGRNGSSDHLTVSESFLKKRDIELIRIERGGEITYHGPGQLVCYPIFDLRRSGLGVVDFVRRLEEVMLTVVDSFGIGAGRDERNRGVWIEGRKLGSIGIAVSHSITYHGLALNVSTDLEPFGWVNPCGLSGVSMTTMSRECGNPVSLDRVRQGLIREFGRVFGRTVEESEGVAPVMSAAQPISTGKPRWLKKRLPSGPGYERTRRLVAGGRLHTVCQEARCPNQFECYGKGTATFLIMGDRCTRNCRFCAVSSGPAPALDSGEPARIGEAVAAMNLSYAVLTSVTRDDLADGGAAHFVATVEAIRARRPETLVEILIPDLLGDKRALKHLCRCRPAVINHNMETVSRLYPAVRPQADYHRSLEVLRAVKQLQPDIVTKSGLMLGLGEQESEIRQCLLDIRQTGCDLLTIGQYLQPSREHVPVHRFVPPREFEAWRRAGLDLGFRAVAAGPHVRSSYRAGKLYERAVAAAVSAAG